MSSNETTYFAKYIYNVNVVLLCLSLCLFVGWFVIVVVYLLWKRNKCVIPYRENEIKWNVHEEKERKTTKKRGKY